MNDPGYHAGKRTGKPAPGLPVFVVQEHDARTHHFDFRLEHGGVLKSWAVPRGVPTTPGERRLAVETEDHSLEFAHFEGTIPEGEYGAGTVRIWDFGHFTEEAWENDRIEVVLEGKKLHGRYVFVRFKKAGENQWLLLKARDG
ncbi:MAG: ATP-dependent DNA ligase [Methanolinea sp.]|nr:ATP-dependent DNA ligase [Methanolinea sp.]